MYCINIYEKFISAPGSTFPTTPQKLKTEEIAETVEEAREKLKTVISEWEELGYIKQKTKSGKDFWSMTPEIGENGYFIYFQIDTVKE